MQYVNANGTNIPAIGFGTFELEPADAQAMTTHALNIGYRHIDTAQAYHNEEAVGAGIRQSDVSRQDVFLTTKVWTDNYSDGDLQQSVADSLTRLGTDYVDLLLLHWPNPDVALAETLGALNEVRERGLTRNIGISNFTTTLIDRAADASAAPLVVNQVEFHPYLSQQPVKDVLDKQHMALTAYCPLAQGRVFSDKTLKRIGQDHGKNAGQVALRWLLQQGDVIVIPRSTQPEHVESNLDVFDFELSNDEMAAVTDLHREDGRIVSPSFAPQWDNAA